MRLEVRINREYVFMMMIHTGIDTCWWWWMYVVQMTRQMQVKHYLPEPECDKQWVLQCFASIIYRHLLYITKRLESTLWDVIHILYVFNVTAFCVYNTSLSHNKIPLYVTLLMTATWLRNWRIAWLVAYMYFSKVVSFNLMRETGLYIMKNMFAVIS